MTLLHTVNLWALGTALAVTPPDGLPEREAIALDVASTVLPVADRASADVAVVHVEEWDGAFAGAAAVRLDAVDAQVAGVLSLGLGHDFARVHLAAGPTVQVVVDRQALWAPGPWVRATVHAKHPPVRSSGLLDDLRNAELATEVRGAWWWSLPGRGSTSSTRTVLTVGSSRLRYGVVAEVPLHRPPPLDRSRWVLGGRVEVRPPSRHRRSGRFGVRDGA